MKRRCQAARNSQTKGCAIVMGKYAGLGQNSKQIVELLRFLVRLA